MSSLSVYHVSTPDLPNKVLTHFEDIVATLAEQGVRFDRWQPAASIPPGARQEDIIAAYSHSIDALMTERGYASVQVMRVTREDRQDAELHARFLDEHSQAEEEVRFFVAGRGLFALHIDDYVYAVLCEKNDLITLPAGMPRWFDMGEQPHFITLRLANAECADAQFTGNDIAGRFPRLED
ncbi:1,2-dihydroxy-3-keto-5-methylthiopentene dioxygenase [Pseudomonas fluorescens]|uniref:Acireductone dioxygenase n=1 Tax=Pseudomonas fluorescens TaxID=294 RepID=A0A0D0MN41_PSEFL|nr:acireductone dioxygenase [Pseudomonas fluorescens]KIQ56775.1 acireductone dioxygenase [Pseudomonas fluorescens]